jgi:hypothetical protein
MKTHCHEPDYAVEGIFLFAIDFSLDGWGPVSSHITAPTLFLATLQVDTPYDTFLDMRGWGRGAVFINGFNLGRYFSGGPTHSLYIPAPLLKTGTNQVSSMCALALFPYCITEKKHMNMKRSVFWDVTQYSLSKINQHFRGAYRFHLQDRRLSQA